MAKRAFINKHKRLVNRPELRRDSFYITNHIVNDSRFLGKRSPIMLDIKQFCELLNISRTKYYQLLKEDKIGPQPVKLCRKVLYHQDDIENWIKAGFPSREKSRIVLGNEHRLTNNLHNSAQRIYNINVNIKFNELAKSDLSNHYEVEEQANKQKVMLAPKAPEILQKVLWMCLFGWEKRKILLSAFLIVFVIKEKVWPQIDFAYFISEIIKTLSTS